MAKLKTNNLKKGAVVLLLLFINTYGYSQNKYDSLAIYPRYFTQHSVFLDVLGVNSFIFRNSENRMYIGLEYYGIHNRSITNFAFKTKPDGLRLNFCLQLYQPQKNVKLNFLNGIWFTASSLYNFERTIFPNPNRPIITESVDKIIGFGLIYNFHIMRTFNFRFEAISDLTRTTVTHTLSISNGAKFGISFLFLIPETLTLKRWHQNFQ